MVWLEKLEGQNSPFVQGWPDSLMWTVLIQQGLPGHVAAPGCTLTALAVGLSHSARKSLKMDECCSSWYWSFLLFLGCLVLIRAGKFCKNCQLSVSYGLVCTGFCSTQSFRTLGSFYLVPLSLGLCNSILIFLHLTKRGRKRRYRSSHSYALEINSKTPCEYLKADSSELYKKKKNTMRVYQSIW